MGCIPYCVHGMDLKDARRLVGLSQAQLDDLAGLRRGTTADIEQGRNNRPAHETVTRYVRAFRRKGLDGVTAEDLFPVPEVPDETGPRGTTCDRRVTEDHRAPQPADPAPVVGA